MKPQGILVLGGTGFVGRHLVTQLAGIYPNIYVISRSAHRLPTLTGVHSYADSLDNLKLLNMLLPQCQVVIHLACSSTPGSSALQPTFEAVNNLLPTLRFLETLQQYPQVSLIYLSSGGAIYGQTTAPLVKEDSPLNPVSYYGAGKAAIEKFIMAFCQQMQRPAIILRPANFYGPEQPYRRGFGIIPTIFHLLQSGQALEIWGNGEAVRDYLYIDDFVELCIQLIEQPPTNPIAKIYNVGSEQGISLNQLCDLMDKITQTLIKRHYQLSRAVDVQRIVLDCSQLHQDYQWFPKVNLEKGLMDTWEWFSKGQLLS